MSWVCAAHTQDIINEKVFDCLPCTVQFLNINIKCWLQIVPLHPTCEKKGRYWYSVFLVERTFS